MTSTAFENVVKLREKATLSQWFTPQQAADFRSRSLTGDQTSAVQAMLNDLEIAGGGFEVEVGDGVACLTAPIVVDQPVAIRGRGASPYNGAIGTRGNGSWFYVNHTGRGFVVDGTSFLGGVRFSGLGTFRPQPTPGPGWTPTGHDFDVYIDNADVTLDDVVLWNPTKGVCLANGAAGRLTMNHVRGQPLQVGIQCDQSLDQLIISNVRFWPYWQNDEVGVNPYTRQNLDAMWLKRCDVPMITNFFTFACRSGIRFSETVQGRVSKLQGANITVDSCKYGLWVDNTVSTGNALGQFNNLVVQGATGLADTLGIFIEGNASQVQIDAADIRTLAKQGIKITGTNNNIRFGLLTVDAYNQDASGAAAIDAASGNIVYFGSQPIFGSGTWISGSGTIEGLLAVRATSGTTDGSGDVTISHGLGLTPTKVFAQCQTVTPFVHMQPHTITSNAFKVRCFDAAGSPITATAFTVQWQAHA